MVTRIGRFAPTPSGPLHLGSLLAALASYLSAKSQGGLWRLRFDDLDTPRQVPGAESHICRSLEQHGLHWDGAIIRESARLPAYQSAWEDLKAKGMLYPCSCSRKELETAGQQGELGWVHPAQCLHQAAPPYSWRVPVAGESRFQDQRLGLQLADLPALAGDFVVWRREGLPSYHLACMVDESLDGITLVVRGGDLLSATHCQLHLAGLLGLRPPEYLHLPLLVNQAGQKLSKQNLAPALEPAQASANVMRVLGWLQQGPPPDLGQEPPSTLLAWALAHWDATRLGQTRQFQV